MYKWSRRNVRFYWDIRFFVLSTLLISENIFLLNLYWAKLRKRRKCLDSLQQANTVRTLNVFKSIFEKSFLLSFKWKPSLCKFSIFNLVPFLLKFGPRLFTSILKSVAVLLKHPKFSQIKIKFNTFKTHYQLKTYK